MERNFIVSVERNKKGFTVFINEFNDIDVTFIVLEHVQLRLRNGTIGGYSSRRNSIRQVTEQKETGLAEGQK